MFFLTHLSPFAHTACRENRHKTANKRRGEMNLDANEALRRLSAQGFIVNPSAPSMGTLVMSPVLPPSMLAGSCGATSLGGQVDPRLLFLQQIQASAQLNQLMFQQLQSFGQMAMAPAYDPYLNPATAMGLQGESKSPEGQHLPLDPSNFPPQVILHDGNGRATAGTSPSVYFKGRQDVIPGLNDFAASGPKRANDMDVDYASSKLPTFATNVSARASPAVDSDREDAVFALSVLQMANQPKFTEQDLELEQRLTTDQERAEILSDMFGQYCSIESDGIGRPDKRARRDLDGESIDFLLKYMRGELERMPNEEKGAYLEALQNCDRTEEFSDARLEHFLRCEGMNAKVM